MIIKFIIFVMLLWYILYNYVVYWYKSIMQNLRIILPQNMVEDRRSYHFFRSYYHVSSFYDHKTTFDTDNSYYGKTFMAQTNNTYFIMVDKDDDDPCLYNIPSREQFIKSLDNYDESKVILHIHFLDHSMIYVKHDNSLNVNNIKASITPMTKPHQFDEYPFTNLPKGEGIIGVLNQNKIPTVKRERSESIRPPLKKVKV